MSFPNIYHHRKVADTSARSCEICFKSSTSVLVTPDNQDFFYVCPSHLKDRGFCSPKIDQAAVEARKKKELEEEMKRVKEEYEEKQKKKKEEKAKKEKEKEKEKDKDKDGKDKEKDKAEKSADDKEKPDGESTEEPKSPPAEEEPRVFEIKSAFYHQRLNKKRQGEMVKRNRERMQDPSFFPSVPKGQP